MKSKTSLFNKAVFKRNLTGYSGFFAVLVFFCLVMMPLRAHAQFTDYLQGYTQSGGLGKADLVFFMIRTVWQMGTFVPYYALTALAAAMFVFSYLFTARNSNMMHTFPVSRMSLFTTNYLSGMLMLVVPQLLGAVLALLVGAFHGAVNGAVIQSYLTWAVVMAVDNLFFFSAAVCVLMFVGNIIAVPVLFFILNFLYRGCMMILDAIISTVCYGVGGLNANTWLGSVLTPMLYMRRISVSDRNISETFSYPVQGIGALWGYFAAALLFTAIAAAAYRKKHVETAGDVITVGWLKPVFRWGMAVCTSALGALLLSSMASWDSFALILCSVLMIGAAVFFIAQMLLERSVHVFTKKKLKECVIYTAVVCALYLSLDADVYGLEKKIPDASEIEAVVVNGGISLYAMDDEEVAWARELHQKLIDSKKEVERLDERTAEGFAFVNLQYLYKDGTQMYRNYWVPESREEGSTAEFIRSYASDPQVILKAYFGIHYPDIQIFGASVTSYDDADDGGQHNTRIAQADALKVYEAVIKDVQAGHFVSEESYSGYAAIVFDIRDEKGYRSAADHYGMMKDAYSQEIWLHAPYTYLNKTLHELGYLSDELYDKIQKDSADTL